MTDRRTTDPPWPARDAAWRHDAPDPPEAFDVPWSWADGLLLVVWSLLAQGVVFGVALAAGVDVDAPVPLLTTVVAAEVVAIGGVLLWLRARASLSWRLLGPLRPTWRHVGSGVLAGGVGFVVILILLRFIVELTGDVEGPQQQVAQLSDDGPLEFALAVVVAVVLAPVLEELIFRGVLFQALRARTGLNAALVISGLVFGFGHVELLFDAEGFEADGLLFVLALSAFGIWLAGVLHRAGSLVAAIVAHATFNLIQLTLAFAIVA